MAQDYPFIGTGWGFPPSFSRGRGVEMSSGLEDIRESLQILLSTEIGERLMQPRYGCDLKRFVFEPLDPSLQAYVKDLVRTSILYFESRVILEELTLVPEPEEGRILIQIDYKVAGTNTRDNYVYPFYLAEGAEIR